MHAPDLSDWFFCEVKGPGDRLRAEQEKKFGALAPCPEGPFGYYVQMGTCAHCRGRDGASRRRWPGRVARREASAEANDPLRTGDPSLVGARYRRRYHPHSGPHGERRPLGRTVAGGGDDNPQLICSSEHFPCVNRRRAPGAPGRPDRRDQDPPRAAARAPPAGSSAAPVFDAPAPAPEAAHDVPAPVPSGSGTRR